VSYFFSFLQYPFTHVKVIVVHLPLHVPNRILLSPGLGENGICRVGVGDKRCTILRLGGFLFKFSFTGTPFPPLCIVPVVHTFS